MNKLLTVMLMLIMSLCMASCGGDDDKEDEPWLPDTPTSGSKYDQMIVGAWQRDDGDYLEFKAGGNGYYMTYQEQEWQIDETFTWIIKNSQITLNWEESETQVAEIVKLTKSELVLKYYSEWEGGTYYTTYTRIH